MSKNLNLALFVSLLLHVLLILLLILFQKQQKKDEQKLTPIGNVPLQIQNEAKLPTSPPPNPKTPPAQQSKPQPEPQPEPTPPQTPKEPSKQEPKKEVVPKKEVLKKEPVKKEPTQEVAKKEMPKPVAKKEPTKQKEVNATKSARKSNLESFLSTPSEPSIEDIANSFTDNKIEKLYGKEFGSFTKEQKKFIRDNLSKIGEITQRHLKYPTLAGELQQDGQNIVEFYLHPNGDITELRLIGKTGYAMLDRNSISTIEIAYKDYPRPKTKTKIRIYVNYIMYQTLLSYIVHF
eukprot:TRINITY_DN21388_c0_g1_i1.p1 TRINITY_DN21388_c0_g1~~TRINITY_DN21388_c0_g1_i1.p1  ORF type:complete len:291 (-),score=41.61 TRINITY_DN21388_c0_g1_i1:466-1338(-)